MVSKVLRLEIELVPEKSWGKSLAQWLPREEWDKLRRLIYRRYNWTCWYCKVYGVAVHCHEVWEYDDKKRIQKLKDLICGCEDCHNIKHWGRTIQLLHAGQFTQEYIDKLRKHFCRVNKCTEQDMIKHITEVGDRNFKRSRYTYRIDFSNLKKIIEVTTKCIELRSG